MRSSDLAALAGVTVRTLRHYHQVGVLPEPERGRNGYRHYTVHDLVRLLRIKRLAALGVPLEKMAALLDTGQQDAAALLDSAALLDQLEAEIDTQMRRLRAQRRLIRLVRAHGSAPDLPPELAPFVDLFAASAVSPAMARLDREHAVLLMHLVGDRGRHRLMEVYARLADPAVRADLVELTRTFDAFPQDASDETLRAFVDRVSTQLAPLVADLADSTDEMLDGARATELLASYQQDALNHAQRTILERIAARLQQVADRPPAS